MSIQDIILNSLNNIQSNSDLRGAFQHILTSSSNDSESQWCPLLDIIDTDNNLYIDIEIPGVVDRSISVDFCNNKMEISGEKINNRQSLHTSQPIKREILYGKFKRYITLPFCVSNKKNVYTSFKNGVLTINIDKEVKKNLNLV